MAEEMMIQHGLNLATKKLLKRYDFIICWEVTIECI